MPSDFTEYFDLRTCQSRDTGYDGSRVWRFIHTKICFTKRLDEPGMSRRLYTWFGPCQLPPNCRPPAADCRPTATQLPPTAAPKA